MSIRALSFVLLLSAVPVVAQEPAAPAPKQAAAARMAPVEVAVSGAFEFQGPTSAPKAPAAVAVSVSFAFEGGTLAELCDLLRRLDAKPNIVVAPLAAAAKLPAMNLVGASVDQALSAACAVAASDVRIALKEFRGPGEPVFTILAQAPKAAEATEPDAAANGAREASPARTATRVFSLNKVLAFDLPVETILTALDAALETANAPEAQVKATLRFHKDSGLLIVRGSAEQLALAQETLGCLIADVPSLMRRRSADAEAPSQPAKTGK